VAGCGDGGVAVLELRVLLPEGQSVNNIPCFPTFLVSLKI
jgi:hypothetical protein